MVKVAVYLAAFYLVYSLMLSRDLSNHSTFSFSGNSCQKSFLHSDPAVREEKQFLSGTRYQSHLH